jgi:lysophospholipase L1-like esterase
MTSVAVHFASGAAFFTGAVCLFAGIVAVIRGKHRILRPVGRLLILLGVFAIASSATPLPMWAYGIWAASLLSWVVCRTGVKIIQRKWQTYALVICVGCTFFAVSWELSYQLPPRPPAGRWDRLVVVGDSLSAEDFTEGGDPWPKLLERGHGIHVDNLAFSGAQSASAAKRVGSEDLTGALVLLEIGGNDLLGAVSTIDFEHGLERLLSLVCRDDNSVVMLELPLPPLYNGYGEVQRRLAQKHHVLLIPKRYFAGVLASAGDRVDGVHLSAAGHKKMCEMLWTLLSLCLVDSALRIPHSELPP